MRLIIASIFVLSILSFGVLDNPPGFDVYVSNGSAAMAADEGGDAPQVPTKQRFTSIMEEHGLALAIVFAFWWGLLANVGSPCVFPLVPITVAYFATQGETRGKRYTILLAGVYVLDRKSVV